MRVISFGTYSKRPEYPRQRNLIEGLRLAGVEVVECRHDMAGGFEARFRSAGSLIGAAGFAWRLALSYLHLRRRFSKLPPAEAILVGYPGTFHARLARRLRDRQGGRALVALDVFAPLYETMVSDRQLLREGGSAARALERVEGAACRAVDLCVIDTAAHADYLSARYGVPPERCRSVVVGPTFAPFPEPAPVREGAEEFTVLFVGTYIPLQGVEVVIEAARRLEGDGSVRFLLVGTGQLRERVEAEVASRGPANVEFRDWVPAAELGDLLRSCDLALGIFGATEKAGRVIPHKVFDACAAGVPLITADTPAIREGLRDGESAWLVPPDDPEALAGAIRRLRHDVELRRRLAEGAHRCAREEFSLETIGNELKKALFSSRDPASEPASSPRRSTGPAS